MPKPHIYKFQGCGVFRAVDTFRKISIFREIVNFTFFPKKYQFAEKYRNPNFALSSKHTNYVKQKTTVKMIKYCQLENRICLLYEKIL